MAPKYLFGRRADWLILVATVVVLPVFYGLVEWSGLSSTAVVLIYDTVLLYPHLLATAPAAFADNIWRRRPWSHVVIPSALAGVVWVGWMSGLMNPLAQVRYYWGLAHVAHQFAWLLHYHRRLNGFASPSRLGLELSVLALGIITTMQMFVGGRVVLPWPGVTSGLLKVTGPVATVLCVAVAAGGSVVIARLVRDGRAGRPIALPIGLWAAVVGCLWMLSWARSPDKLLLLMYFGLVGWHDVQYLAWTWLTYRNRLQHQGISPMGRTLRFRRYWAGLYGMAVLSYVLGGPSMQSAFGLACVFVHYYLDHFIWHRREAYAWFGTGR